MWTKTTRYEYSTCKRRLLVRTVRNRDNDLALKPIYGDKDPGCDGVNSCFFKVIWPWARLDIYKAVVNFIESCGIYRPMNCTTITLIPNSPHNSSVLHYRTILHYVVDKLIAKVLAFILQGVISYVIDPA